MTEHPNSQSGKGQIAEMTLVNQAEAASVFNLRAAVVNSPPSIEFPRHVLLSFRPESSIRTHGIDGTAHDDVEWCRVKAM